MDFANVKTAIQIETMLTRHFDAINTANPFFTESTKVFIPENNLGFEAIHMNNMIKHRFDLITYWEKPGTGGRPGIRKGAETADNYINVVDTSLRTNQLRFSLDLFTETRNHTPASAKTELREEMERYCVTLQLPKTEFEKTKRVVGGKVGGCQDDLYITLAQAMLHGRVVQRAPPQCFS